MTTCDQSIPTDRRTRPQPAGRRPTGAVAALAAGTAVLVAAEFIPAGVLPLLARDLEISEGTAGLAVAATSLAGAVTAPLIAQVLPRADRRRVLLVLLGLAVVADLAVAAAPAFWLLLTGRFVLGTAIAGFWSFAFGVGVHAGPGPPWCRPRWPGERARRPSSGSRSRRCWVMRSAGGQSLSAPPRSPRGWPGRWPVPCRRCRPALAQGCR